MIKKFNVIKTRQLGKINKILRLLYRKPVSVNNIALKDVKNILIVDFALIGDMVMNIPFLRTIRFNCPNCKITMVCMKWAIDILGDQNLVDEFIVFDGKNGLSSLGQVIKNFGEIHRVLKIINSKGYDIGFEPKGDLRHTLFMHYTRCNRTITYNYTGGEYLVTDSFSPRIETKHLIDEKLDLLEMSGFSIVEEYKVPELIISKKQEAFLQEFIRDNDLHDKRIIGIHPGASNINKQYRCYPELVQSIKGYLDDNTVLLIFEGPDEEEIVNQVSNQAREETIPYLRIKRGIKDYMSIVSLCNLMICNDSAAGHIASAYGIPCIVIFGAVYPDNAAPRGKKQNICISIDIDCKPCTLPNCPLKTYECIERISVKEVKEAFLQVMKDQLMF